MEVGMDKEVDEDVEVGMDKEVDEDVEDGMDIGQAGGRGRGLVEVDDDQVETGN